MKVCSKCRRRLPHHAFYKNRARKDGYQTYCKECSHRRRVQYYKEHQAEEDAANKKRRERYRRRFIRYKQTLACARCGEARWYVLDFHHPKRDKESTVGLLITRQAAWDTVIKEIAKCRVLCANCHRELHHRSRTRGIGVSA